MRKIFYTYIVVSLFIYGCTNSNKQSSSAQFLKDSIAVVQLIKQGNSIYAQKANYSNFSKSLDYYDSAWQLANQTNNTYLLAEAVFAKGRAYDAINDNPQKTIDYYTEAAKLFKTIPTEQKKALYIKHLVAHSYDKVLDSLNCVKILNQLYNEILQKPDSIKKELSFTVEMALISTVVKNYQLADNILNNLTTRTWIKNDSTEYDYLNHYLLVKAKIDVLYSKAYNSLYLDSLEKVFAKSKNLNDSIYYSNELWELYKQIGNKEKGNYFLTINNSVFSKFNNPQSVRETREKLAKMELAAVEQKRKAEHEKAASRNLFIYILSGLLVVISLLAIFLTRRNKEIKKKQQEVVHINKELHQKNLQNELLNKEIHHRVKNNLQMIMSLVYMQESNTETEEVKENMLNIRLRIESIANLHKQLMEQNDSVDLRKYIQYLVSNATNLMADNKKVLTYLDVQPLEVPQKISFPLGLIINEWITNSIKYADPIAGALEITVQITNGENSIKVIYKDNGKIQQEPTSKKSLGLDIINILTEQMDATIEYLNNNKFHYKLTIPLTDGE